MPTQGEGHLLLRESIPSLEAEGELFLFVPLLGIGVFCRVRGILLSGSLLVSGPFSPTAPLLIATLVIVACGAKFLLWGEKSIARGMGVGEHFVGLTFTFPWWWAGVNFFFAPDLL